MNDVPVRPASTVVLLRDGATGLEALLVRRNRALAFAGGLWVFPGGAVDDEDRRAAGGDADEAARIAAAREAREEAGLSPDPDSMVFVSHWTTPVAEKKRFATWFYVGAVGEHEEVTIDGEEIHDYQWLEVNAALAAHRARKLPMLPPTYITLCALTRYGTVSQAVAGEKETPCPWVLPLVIPTGSEGQFATIYPGDVAYESGDLNQEGPRHRAWMENGAWRYQYEGVSDALPLYPQD